MNSLEERNILIPTKNLFLKFNCQIFFVRIVLFYDAMLQVSFNYPLIQNKPCLSKEKACLKNYAYSLMNDLPFVYPLSIQQLYTIKSSIQLFMIGQEKGSDAYTPMM